MNQPQNQTAYPLSWPPGWKRTDSDRRLDARFSSIVSGEKRSDGYVPRYTRQKSMVDATGFLVDELRRLRATAIVISTNIELRADGLPYSNRRAPSDPGAAVYFTFGKKPIALACDKWRRVEDNLYAIAKHIESLRGQERWGVGNVERAFSGYLRLPAPGESGAATWYAVLGVSANATFEAARDAYRAKAREVHPDSPGGSHEAMVSLNSSWDQARIHFGQ